MEDYTCMFYVVIVMYLFFIYSAKECHMICAAGVKIEARYPTTSDCVFMANTVTNLPLRLLFALRRITFVTELYFNLYILVFQFVYSCLQHVTTKPRPNNSSKVFCTFQKVI
jgi:hypothetical protein